MSGFLPLSLDLDRPRHAQDHPISHADFSKSASPALSAKNQPRVHGFRRGLGTIILI
jgi:hypothetical protein